MDNADFPFGAYPVHYDEKKKIFVKKGYNFRTEKEKQILLEKVNILKDMYHRNVINMRNV
jgi:hypothetical protein